MRKQTALKLIFLVFVLCAFVITFFIIGGGLNQDTRIKIASLFATPSQKFIENNNIQTIEIKYQKEVSKHFEKLFKYYTGEGLGDENDQFFQYYDAHNEWKKAKLTYQNQTYDVKIKSLGRTPYAHKFGEHFSLGIKFKPSESPFWSRKIRFVIYNRRQMKNAFSSLLANVIRLPMAEHQLVLGKVGSHSDYLFFIEERYDEAFFIKRKLPWILFNKKIDGSLVYDGMENINSLQNKISEHVNAHDNLSDSLKDEIISRYHKLNEAVYFGNVAELLSLIDVGTMIEVNAFRIINGDEGHGFNPSNFLMAFDTVDLKFNLMVHPDCYGTTLRDCKNPFTFIDNGMWPNRFLILVNSNPVVRMKSLEKAKHYASSVRDSFPKSINKIRNHYLESHFFEFSAINNGSDGRWLLNNLSCLIKAKDVVKVSKKN